MTAAGLIIIILSMVTGITLMGHGMRPTETLNTTALPGIIVAAGGTLAFIGTLAGLLTMRWKALETKDTTTLAVCASIIAGGLPSRALPVPPLRESLRTFWPSPACSSPSSPPPLEPGASWSTNPGMGDKQPPKTLPPPEIRIGRPNPGRSRPVAGTGKEKRHEHDTLRRKPADNQSAKPPGGRGGRNWSIQMGSYTKHLRTEPIDHQLTVKVECGGREVHTLTTDSIERTGCIPCLQKYYARVGREQAQGGGTE